MTNSQILVETTILGYCYWDTINSINNIFTCSYYILLAMYTNNMSNAWKYSILYDDEDVKIMEIMTYSSRHILIILFMRRISLMLKISIIIHSTFGDWNRCLWYNNMWHPPRAHRRGRHIGIFFHYPARILQNIIHHPARSPPQVTLPMHHSTIGLLTFHVSLSFHNSW